MKKLILLIISFISINLVFSQDKSVQELKNSQDVRKKYVNPEPTQPDVPKEEIPKSILKTTYVNTFIGTGGHGHTYPGATAPFGMIQLSPDTRATGWDGCAGYHYSDSVIYGFSHTHLSGVGVPDYCDLLIVPQSGKSKIEPGYKVVGGYGSRFNHKSEKAAPGYYEVDLIDAKVNVKLATTERCGIHEYTFKQKKGKKFILIDLDHRDKLLAADIKIEDKKTISGYRISQDWAKNQHFYFAMDISVPFTKSKLLTKNGHHKLLLEFPDAITKIMIKVGISAVDAEGARGNLDYEILDFDLGSVFTSTVEAWGSELNKVDFTSDNKEEITTFYSALYHSFLSPNIFSDVDGRYRGRDNVIHKLTNLNENHYTVFSLWDTYRATNPLFTLLQKLRTGEFVNTFLRQYDEGGSLPVWELAANETNCMIGYHAVSVIADAYIKGIQNFDTEKALKAMLAISNKNEFGKNQFAKNGFISLNDEPESVSKTLEYAYDDYCISVFANAIQTKQKKNDAIIKEYNLRSMNFINEFDPTTQFMRARKSGSWYTPFDPAEVNFNYTEANSYQYSLYAPHAIGVLRDLLGGKVELEKWLDNLFTADSKLKGRDQVDITGLIGQYAHGNEPSHHLAYLYNYTNHPHKTQYYLDKILNEMYSSRSNGLVGNEDCGQMSSWYVLNAAGIYQIAPGNPYFEIGRPLGQKMTMHLENRKDFDVKVINQSKENKYIQKIKLNGRNIKRLYLEFDEINGGGNLEIELGPEPNAKVDTYEHAPTISTTPEEFIPVPYFEQNEKIFDDSIMVSLNYPKLPSKKYRILYTTNGSEPTMNSPEYFTPIKIDNTTIIKAVLVAGGITGEEPFLGLGKSVATEFVKRNQSIHLQLTNEYSNQYPASGSEALIDGVSGGNDYRTGDWQGFYANDLIAEVAIENPKLISEIGIRCLEDANAWIFYPQSIKFEVSYDGINFINIDVTEITPAKDINAKSTKLFTTQTSKKETIKKIRITAKNSGKCPDWHPGKGLDSWIFADEIIIR